jgi:circadian clock protein KaiB
MTRTGKSAKKYSLCLYVTGASARSTAAITSLRSVCEEYLPGRCALRIIDIHQQPRLARAAKIIAAPTLVRVSPPPERRFTGDMSDIGSVLNALEIERKA